MLAISLAEKQCLDAGCRSSRPAQYPVAIQSSSTRTCTATNGSSVPSARRILSLQGRMCCFMSFADGRRAE
eukprot:scaffold148662_cov47-Prasinocladus_malaysianus.AAC.1